MKFILVSMALAACWVAAIAGQLLPEESPLEVNEWAFAPCNLRISNDVAKPSPLMVYPDTTASIRASNAAGLLSFGHGDGVQLACSGAGNYLRGLPGQQQEATAICVGNTTFSVNGVEYAFSALSCQRWPDHVQVLAGACLWGKSLIKTGFEISTGFVEAYEVCHDTQLHHTYYTKFVMGKDTAGFQSGVARPDWEQGEYFKGLDITNLYRRVSQRDTFTTLFGSRELAEERIHLTNDYFLSKGHLVAKADFLHGTHQMTTFWYTNAAPQWQTFNGQNWNTLEDNVRSFAARINKDLDVYTGTYGRAELPDVNGNYVDLYLSSTKRAPAPRMFWKVVYDPATQAGVAFIGLNNPYQSAESVALDVRCRDISSSISWLTWRQFDVRAGYSYSCEVNDFRANFPDVPSFPVTSVLR